MAVFGVFNADLGSLAREGLLPYYLIVALLDWPMKNFENISKIEISFMKQSGCIIVFGYINNYRLIFFSLNLIM